jgi:hypothetical protein
MLGRFLSPALIYNPIYLLTTGAKLVALPKMGWNGRSTNTDVVFVATIARRKMTD